jgi:hydroxymethylpyrimidine pyrophosphatase-like HAD family hydrolase
VVKAAADVVTASNNEEGVALAIERYILGRGESG